MQRWLVMSNCQTIGVANSLSLLNPGVTVEPCDVWQLQHEPERWRRAAEEADCVFVLHELLAMGLVDTAAMRKSVIMPSVVFAGYHPDLCYVWSHENAVKTPLWDYNSIIALAAFKKGLSESDALRLYNSCIFEAGGYFELWPTEKRHLLAHFNHLGYELSQQFREWTLRTAFMHGLNHPKINCIYDIAIIASRKAGFDPVTGPLLPHDNLCNSAVFAIYHEIAEFCGIEGFDLFKPLDQYKVLTLADFVAASFQAYRQYDPENIEVSQPFRERYTAIYDAI